MGAVPVAGTQATGAAPPAGGAGSGFSKLTVAVTVVFTNVYVVKVDDTTNWFLFIKNRLSLKLCRFVNMPSEETLSSLVEETSSSKLRFSCGNEERAVGTKLKISKKISC